MSSLIHRRDFASWGRVLRAGHDVAFPHWRDELSPLVRSVGLHRRLLAVGLRRSYGDSPLNPDGAVIDMTGLNRAISFDPEKRRLRAEAGISFDALLQLLIPKGFFPPVTPGTRYVTLGGAVANDVHGKNHERAGTLGRWVRRFGLLRSDGEEREFDCADQTGLFAATIGGLGLTGVITWVEFEVTSIASARMDVEIIPFANADEFFQIAAKGPGDFDHTVAWVDCMAKGGSLGRGIYIRGRHSAADHLEVATDRVKVGVPFEFPQWVLNKWTVGLFNALYYLNNRRQAGHSTTNYASFFYPLDSIRDWNRIYGRRGMYQYQSVVPPQSAQDATKAMLREISNAGQGSFLAVLKMFGSLPSPGLLSFPREGTTLALDFPNHGASTLALMERLDAIVAEAGGRLYVAKDGRMPAHMFRAGYPQWEKFRDYVDPRFSSRFWARVAA